MTNSALPAQEEIRRRESARPIPLAVEGCDILDGDVVIEPLPGHRAGTVRVALDYAGRGRPIAVDDPRAEG